jgi:WD40 repeat protein
VDRTSRRIAVCLLAALAPTLASAQFASVETNELRLLYLDPFQTYLVPHVGRCFINTLQFERELFGYTPEGKLTVFLKDFSDIGNASAGAVPRDFLSFETSPMSTAYEAVSTNERFNWLFNHEMVHVLTGDGAAKRDRRARAFFGGKVLPNNEDPESILYFYLTAPRVASPGWYLEGIATFVETWMAGGQGRAQGPYDEMVFRSMVRDGATIYDPLGLVSEGIKVDFQVEINSYLYGTRFMTYLGHHYSPEQVIKWVSRPEGSKAYYAKNFKATFGLPLDQAWDDWIAFEKEFQEKNLAAIRTYPTTPHKDLSTKALGSVSRAYVDEKARKVYVGFNYPGLVAHVGSISLDDGTVEPIAEVKGPVLLTVTSLAWDPDGRMLYYTTDNGEYRDVRSLDPATGKGHRLLKDARIGDLVFDRTDKSLWGIRHFNAIATLVKIPYPYKEWKQIYSWPYGEVPYDIDVSPDGKLLSASIGGIDGLHAVHVMKTEDLLAGKVEDVAKFDFGTFVPSGFSFSPDGRYLYGSSYYTGVSNIFRYEIATGKLDAMSNTETGFFRPVTREDGSMVVFRFSGQGFVPATIDPKPLDDVSPITFLGAQLVEKHPVVKDWKLGSPAPIPFEGMVVKHGPYKSFSSIRSESFYPILEGYKDSPAAGMRFNFSDPLQLNRFVLHASYSPDNELPSEERLHLRLEYKRYDWTVEAKWNGADFYDLFGPTKVSRKGYSVRAAWDHTIFQDRPKRLTMTVDGAYYGDLDTLPYYQNIASPADRLATTFVKFDFANVRSSLGSVDQEKGQKAQLYLSATHTPDPTCTPTPGLNDCNATTAPEGGFFPQVLATYDLGFQLGLAHSSIWLRGAAGGGTGDPTNPFANFFFGGFGNNWVDKGDVKRYRQWYAFPGLEINEVGGRTFAKAMLEWNAPPIRFKRLGTPGFYASWLRTSIFAGVLATNFDRRYGDEYAPDEVTGVWTPTSTKIYSKVADAGIQMDLRITWLSRLDMTLSFGYAAAFESGIDTRHEGMVSLKVMP